MAIKKARNICTANNWLGGSDNYIMPELPEKDIQNADMAAFGGVEWGQDRVAEFQREQNVDRVGRLAAVAERVNSLLVFHLSMTPSTRSQKVRIRENTRTSHRKEMGEEYSYCCWESCCRSHLCCCRFGLLSLSSPSYYL